MTPPRTPREQSLRRSARARVALVGAATAGSLGLVTVLGVGLAAPATTTSSVAPASSQQATGHQSTSQQSTGVALSSGSGTAHASTAGS